MSASHGMLPFAALCACGQKWELFPDTPYATLKVESAGMSERATFE